MLEALKSTRFVVAESPKSITFRPTSRKANAAAGWELSCFDLPDGACDQGSKAFTLILGIGGLRVPSTLRSCERLRQRKGEA